MLLFAPGSVTGQPVCGQGRAWTFGPFDKPKDANPVITPSPASRFRSAMSDTIARWEEHATFNPAAVVKDGRVFVLYRAEDTSGERMIGGHTSRIGLAESQDGLHFTRRSAPVRSEEHTSELQSRLHLVCRLLLEKKNQQTSLPILHAISIYSSRHA